MSNATGPTKQRGCLFYGCLSIAVLALLMALFVAVGLYFAKRTFNNLIVTYTATAPVELPQLTYTTEQMDALRRRLVTFRDALDQGQGSVELVLNADDLNALVAENQDLKGRVFVTIDEDQVKGQVSIPLSDYGPLKLQGRHLNGTAAFKVQLKDGRLEVRLDQVTVKDKPLPVILLNELRKQNLAEQAQANPEASSFLQKLESLEVAGGKVVIRSRSETPARPVEAPAPQP